MKRSLTLSAERDQLSCRLWRQMNLCAASGDEHGWMDARTRLYNLYERLALKTIGRYIRDNSLISEDLAQECRLAVVEAIDGWDGIRGSLQILIVYRIRFRAYHYIRRQEFVIRPEWVYRKHQHEPFQDEKTEKVSVLSFSVFDTDDAERNGLDVLPDPQAAVGYDQCETHLLIGEAMEMLDDKTRQCVSLYFGLEGEIEHTLQEIGDQFGHTRQAVATRLQVAKPLLAAALEGVL